MKVRDRNDTVSGTRKVVLIDNLTLSTSYNMAKDSLKWSTLNISGRTKLFKNLDIRYASMWDPYVLDSSGTKNLDQFEWTVNRRLFRKEDMSWTASFNLTLNNKTFQKKDGDSEEGAKGSKDSKNSKTKKEEKSKAGSLPWALNLNYSLSYKMKYSYPGYIMTKEDDIVQTLGFSGNVQVTPNWKVSIRSGYDFERNELSYTSVDVYRDLHCWEMRFSWIPFGTWKSWNFGINIKSSMFKDLKVEKKKTPFD
jgi:lipopolysaccharide assembly outer membrane protein LptD (OstA)